MSEADPWRLRIYDSLSSTSELCRDLALAGEPDGLAVLAHRQEAGRASHGRDWQSPPGNMYLSVLLRPRGPVRHGGLWSLLTAVALAEAAEAMLPQTVRPALKWPNDVLLQGGKLAGILLDSTADAVGDFTALVIGIGLNLATAPDLPDRATSCIAEFAPPPSPEAAARLVLARLAHWRHQGFDAVRTAWLARADQLGAAIVLRQGSQEVSGRFAGLADDGSLMLAFAAGEVRVQTGVAHAARR